MARMSIDDKFSRDPRVIRLGRRMGWSRRETMGAMIDVFQIVYDRERDTLPDEDIDIAAEREGFAVHMIECDLAERTRAGVRVKGAAERIEYLRSRAEAGRVGGLKSGESRRNRHEARHEANDRSKRSTASSEAEASRNPPDPVPDSAPDPVPVPENVASPPTAARPRSASPARSTPSGDHQRVIAEFDRRYAERYGKKPTWGAKQGQHVKRLLASHSADEVIRRIGILFDSPPHWLTGVLDLGTLVQHFDKLVQPSLTSEARRQDPKVGRVEPMSPSDYPSGDVPWE